MTRMEFQAAVARAARGQTTPRMVALACRLAIAAGYARNQENARAIGEWLAMRAECRMRRRTIVEALAWLELTA